MRRRGGGVPGGGMYATRGEVRSGLRNTKNEGWKMLDKTYKKREGVLLLLWMMIYFQGKCFENVDCFRLSSL